MRAEFEEEVEGGCKVSIVEDLIEYEGWRGAWVDRST